MFFIFYFFGGGAEQQQVSLLYCWDAEYVALLHDGLLTWLVHVDYEQQEKHVLLFPCHVHHEV